MVSSDSTSGVDKIPMQDEYKSALDGNIDLDRKIVKLGELNELAYENLTFSINTSYSVEKLAYG